LSLHLGLDLGGTNIKVVVLEHDGDSRVVFEETLTTAATAGPDAVTSRLVEAGRAAFARHGEFASVGLGVPGLFDSVSGDVTLFPNLPGRWKGHPLRSRVSDGLGQPVTMINDARAFTLAEGNLGAGRGCRIMVAMVLGTGVGGGITVDGKLHLGAFGTAGEIGHQTILPDGPLCGCGNRGCVEALTKARVLADLAGKDTAEEAYEAAANGDERSQEAIAEVAMYLGIALANVVTILGPERIVIGGGIARAGNLLLDPMRRSLHQRVTLVPIEKVEVLLAELGAAAGAIGAALAGMDESEIGRHAADQAEVRSR
jgi:glucokinase